MNIPSILAQFLATVAGAFVVVFFIIGIAHDRNMTGFTKIMWVIFLGIVVACISFLF